MTTSGSFEVTETLCDFELTVSPVWASYGFWGEHGYAALALGGGPLTAEVEGTAFSLIASHAGVFVSRRLRRK